MLVVVSHTNFPLMKYGGIAGVTLFFVLSGYLITSILLKERERQGQIHLGRFYLRRALRLLPALVVAVAGCAALAIAAGAPGDTVLTGGLAALFYVGNLAQLLDFEMGAFSATWSLAMEEQYYLLWPIVLMLALKGGRRLVIALALALTMVSLIARFAGPSSTADGFDVAYHAPHTNVWAILLGSILALHLSRHRPTVTRRAAVLAMIGLVLVASVAGLSSGLQTELTPMEYRLQLLAGPVAAAFSLILVTACATSGLVVSWLESPILLFFGWISYSLYLWHSFLHHVVARDLLDVVGLRELVVGLFVVPVAVAAAYASRRWVEEPFLQLKDRLESRWRTPQLPAPGDLGEMATRVSESQRPSGRRL